MIMTVANLIWSWQIDGSIVAAAVLCAMACALLGNFLVLRKMSMMGDAISHAVLPGLAERFSVVLFDNRGIGESDTPPGPYTAAEMAADARQVLDEAEIERAHVVGTSLGGMVAQELALAHPGRVDRLVLACTTPGGPKAHAMPSLTVALMAEAATLDPG